MCPWNRFSQHTGETDFHPRHGLGDSDLVSLFSWSEEEFLERTAGSAIRRAGYLKWLRNIAVALGNAPTTEDIVQALNTRMDYPDETVREHVLWALEQHGAANP